jgi:hypothetical protein
MATHSPLSSLLTLVDEVRFHPSEVFHFDPSQLVIYFDPRRISTDNGRFQLLHEVSHLLLGHPYRLPREDRWRMERDAWDVARILARNFMVSIHPEYAEVQLEELRRRLSDGLWDGRG